MVRVAQEAFAEGLHPFVVLVELLSPGQGSPRNHFVDVGVAGVVADMLVFQAGPDRGGNDLARLRDDVAEADRLVFLAPGPGGVVAAGKCTRSEERRVGKEWVRACSFGGAPCL